MTRREASEQYHIPPAILQEYERWGFCCTGARGQYSDEDLQRLSTMMTLHDVGFTAEEVETYMRLLLEQPESGAQRLKMMERRRGEKLDEIIAKFKAANYTILYEPATNGGNEVRAITFEDNILEVCC